MLVMSVTAGVSCYFFRNEIMHLLYHESNLYWAKIFGWLMLNFIPMSSVYIFGTLLTAKGSLRILNFIALVGMILNVGLNLFLIPSYGALGATIATLTTQFFVATVHLIAANKQFSFQYKTNDLIKVFSFTVICIVALFAIKLFPINWMLDFILAISTCLLTAMFTKLIPLHQFYALLKNKAAS